MVSRLLPRLPAPPWLAAALAVSAALAWTGGAEGVVGGSTIDIEQAPWQVLVIQSRGGRVASTCGGSIVTAQLVVTAAHCVYTGGGRPADPLSMSIRAGISDFVSPRPSDVEQTRGVASFRVHPGYSYSEAGSSDDVAVLTLDAPLDLSGPKARAIGLPVGQAPLAGGQTVGFAGFGRQSGFANPDGSLNWMEGEVSDPARCGRENAVVLCVSSPQSAVCSGDSGSALVLGQTIIGIASTGAVRCPRGGAATFTNVAAPEILRFIQGDDNPPAAPRRLARAGLVAPAAMQVGQRVACDPGRWSGSPRFSFVFEDARTGATLQRGAAATYVLRARDVGRRVACRVTATNAGGSGVDASEAAPRAVQRAPRVTAAATSGRAGGSAVMRISITQLGSLRGRATVCVHPARRIGKNVCRAVRLGTRGRVVTALRVPLAGTAPAINARVGVRVELGDGRTLTTVGRIRVRR